MNGTFGCQGRWEVSNVLKVLEQMETLYDGELPGITYLRSLTVE